MRKSQYFPFWMFSAKQGHYWYHFYNVFGMTLSLTGDWTGDLPHSKPAHNSYVFPGPVDNRIIQTIAQFQKCAIQVQCLS